MSQIHFALNAENPIKLSQIQPSNKLRAKSPKSDLPGKPLDVGLRL